MALPEMPHYRRHPLRFIAGFIRGYRMTVQVLQEFQPDAMLGLGSFAALPVGHPVHSAPANRIEQNAAAFLL